MTTETSTEWRLYTKTNCVQCGATKRKLEEAGIDFEEINIEEDDKALEYVRDWLGYSQAPVVEIPATGESWAGFQPDRIAAAVMKTAPSESSGKETKMSDQEDNRKFEDVQFSGKITNLELKHTREGKPFVEMTLVRDGFTTSDGKEIDPEWFNNVRNYTEGVIDAVTSLKLQKGDQVNIAGYKETGSFVVESTGEEKEYSQIIAKFIGAPVQLGSTVIDRSGKPVKKAEPVAEVAAAAPSKAASKKQEQTVGR